MSAKPARHLALVDLNTGEKLDSRELGAMQHELEELRTKFKMAQRDVAAKNLRIAALETDKARARLDYERYGDVERIARYWHRKHGANPRVNPMSPGRFDAVRGILEQERVIFEEPAPGRKRRTRRVEPMYTMEECKAAVDGNAFDHFSKKRRNGSEQHYTDLEFVFRDSAHFEECRSRCPYDWTKVALQAVTRDTPSQVPSHGIAGQAVPPGGFTYGSSNPLGMRSDRVLLRAQAGRPVFRGWLHAGVAGQPAA